MSDVSLLSFPVEVESAYLGCAVRTKRTRQVTSWGALELGTPFALDYNGPRGTFALSEVKRLASNGANAECLNAFICLNDKIRTDGYSPVNEENRTATFQAYFIPEEIAEREREAIMDVICGRVSVKRGIVLF